MILDYISPVRVYKNLVNGITDRLQYLKYSKIINTLNESGRLDSIGFKVDSNANMYLGINLNPELLMYSDTSQTTVELKMIGEKMTKYNDFLEKEGLLDSIKVDYDRVLNDTFYGYVIQISYNFNNRSNFNIIYGIIFNLLGLLIISGLIIYIIK